MKERMSNVTRPSLPRRIARVGVAACIVLGVAWDVALGQPGASTLDEDMVRAVAAAAEIAAQRDTEARAAQAAANAAQQEATEARARADAAIERTRALEGCGREPGCPGPPAQIRTCALTHTAPTLGG